MAKKIEQLYLKDLHKAFDEYLDTQLLPSEAYKIRDNNWRIFIRRVKKYCSIVDTM